MKLFLRKNAKFSSAGGSAPRPPCLRRLGALPPNPQTPAAGGFASTPPKQPPHCEFLVTRLDGRDAFPHRDLGVPHRDLSAGLWEEKSPVFGRNNRLNFRFRPEKAFGFRWRPFFWDYLIFTEKLPQSNSEIMKIWVKLVYGSTSKKVPSFAKPWLRACSSLRFSQRCKSVPPCKILRLKYCL